MVRFAGSVTLGLLLAGLAPASPAPRGPLVPVAGVRTPEVPKLGAEVPDFKMADQDGRLITAASLKGKRYLLAFYPKDFTGG
ncbi:MAG: redoxin domain-containing protein [Planctomycetes bacterium]|nr:redoxin domain-containing protein [Planctomycetota bacterium]